MPLFCHDFICFNGLVVYINVSKNNIGEPKLENIFGATKWLFFFNIGIAYSTLMLNLCSCFYYSSLLDFVISTFYNCSFYRYCSFSSLTYYWSSSLFLFMIVFSIVIALYLLSFIFGICSLLFKCYIYCYCSPNYFNSNCCCSFFFLDVLTIIFALLFAFAFKCNNYRCCNSWKIQNYGESNRKLLQKKQRGKHQQQLPLQS